MPKILGDLGYRTAAYVAGVGGLHRELGFQDVQYSGDFRNRYPGIWEHHIGSVDERVVFKEATSWLKSQKKPWMLFVQTASTHYPYTFPPDALLKAEVPKKYVS